MQCYTELIPPTAVTHALSVHLLGPNASNLVVVKTSLLQIFNVKDQKSGDQAAGRPPRSVRLVLVGEYPLAGIVTSVARVKAADTKTGGEALLISLKDAKVSLLEWDPENHRISTISIHYYEGDKVRLAPYESSLADFESKLVVDPRSRCAALRFASRQLAIIPFRQSEDDLGDADDGFLEDADKEQRLQRVETNGTQPDRKPTPYAPSFVLPLTALDPALTHPVDLAFLFEYREPTFGIVSASRAVSQSIHDERKDILSYTVITLDIGQRASTSLLSVKGLPSDIWKVIPLPSPVGGALLLGTNELIHVDQSGKTNAVAVNEFARQCTDFGMTDQSTLSLRLENACVETLNIDTGDLLIVLDSGRLAILTFRIDGRTVSALSVHLVEEKNGGALTSPFTTGTARVSSDKIFVSSEVGDAKVISWTAQTAQVARKRNHAQMLGEDLGFEIDEADLEDLDEDMDDDLYGEEDLSKSTMLRKSKAVAPENYIFSVIDELRGLAPVKQIAFGEQSGSLKRRKVDTPPVEMLAAVGEGNCSRLVRISQDFSPDVVEELRDSAVQAVFPVTVAREDGTEVNYIITSEVEDEEKGVSRIHTLPSDAEGRHSPSQWQVIEGQDFEREGKTSNVVVLRQSRRIVHVREAEVRTYDADLGLSQILPVLDATTEEELQVIHSSFCEPYLLLLRSDSSLQILKAEDNGDFDDVPIGDSVSSHKWLSACLYESEALDTPLCFLLSESGGLQVFELPNLQIPSFVAPQLAALPAVLTTEDRQRRAASRETLAEILFADLGDDGHKSPYLILRSSTDEITLYEPFHTSASDSSSSFCHDLRFRKVPGLHIPRYSEELETIRPAPMKACVLAGRAVVLVSGDAPGLVLRTSTSMPRVVDIRGKSIRSMTPYTIAGGDALVSIDSDNCLHQLKVQTSSRFDVNGCVYQLISPLPPSHQINEITYDPDRKLYVLVSSQETAFYTTEEELAEQEANAGLSMHPKGADFFIHLLDAQTSTIISTQTIRPYEMVTSLVCAPLETSEVTHNPETMIAVGTITEQADNYAAKGALYIYRVIPVVPEPDRPETRWALHLHTREETRAGITSLTGCANLLGTAQGQKLMLRGLREDHQLLPVAFLDALTYTTCFKTLASSRLWLASDALKGLWFGGFNEEPPRLNVFGRSAPDIPLVTAEFLPHDGQLYLLGVDERSALRVWQFEPEHPKSLGGAKLIEKCTFEMGHCVTGMKLLPTGIKTDAEEGQRLWQLLTTSRSGQLGIVTPLEEAQYRRLAALQSQLTNVLEHPAGLNPRAYRNVRSEDGGGRGVVDGDLIRRIAELGAGRRSEIVGRVAGSGEWWEIRGDLEVISGKGLDFF